jgi:hypothetical protein
MFLHWFALHVTLRHPLFVNWLLQQPVASAGSLAVILQPAFVHFVYVLVITFVFYSVPMLFTCLYCWNSCLFILVEMFRTGYADLTVSLARVYLDFMRLVKVVSVPIWSAVNRFVCCVSKVYAVFCACSNLSSAVLNTRTVIPLSRNQSAVSPSSSRSLRFFIQLFITYQTYPYKNWCIIWLFW